MFCKRTIAVAQKIGAYYLKKNNGDYDKAADEITNLRITEVLVVKEKQLVIKCSRVGLFIGKRGHNIEDLSKFLGMEVNVIENLQSIEDFIIPHRPDEYMDGCNDESYQKWPEELNNDDDLDPQSNYYKDY